MRTLSPKTSRLLSIILLSALCNPAVFAGPNPVTREYVDLQIADLKNQIANIPPRIIYTAGNGIAINNAVITNTAPAIIYRAGVGIGISNDVITNTSPGITYTAGTGIEILNEGSERIINNTQPAYTAGDGIAITDNVISATDATPTYEIGDQKQGGTIIWLNAARNHGLVATNTDQIYEGMPWYSTAFDNGATNIVSNPGNYETAGQAYRDWHLPTASELTLMCQQAQAGTFGDNKPSGIYWTSSMTGDIDTEDNKVKVLTIAIDNNNSCAVIPQAQSVGAKVRAVRAF